MKTRKKLFLLVKVKPMPFVLYGTVILLWYCMYILSALCLQALFDVFGEKNSVSDTIYMSVFLLVVVYMLRGMTSFVVIGLESWSGFSVDASLKLNTMKQIFDAYGAKFPDIAKGEILNIFRDDIDQIKTFLLQLTELMALSAYFCVMLVVLFKINPFILMSVLTVAFASVFLIRLGYKKLGAYQREMRKTDGAVTAFAGEILDSILAVKMADKQQSVLEYFCELGDRREKANVKESVLRQLLNSSNNFFYAFGEGLILLLAFQMMCDGSFSMGDFTIFTFLFESISDTISSMVMVVTAVPQTEVAMKRVEELVEAYGETKDKMSDESVMEIYRRPVRTVNETVQCGEPLQTLEVRNLSICTKSGTPILNDASFVLEKGTITVVAGKTAAGKSMLLRTILGMYPMREGTLSQNGREIANPKEYFVPPVAAYTPQNPNFFGGSIRNNILLGKKQNNGTESVDVSEKIDMAVLEKDISEMEHGLDTMLGEKGSGVSGGQRKRIALARMYAGEAELNVMDDVSNALDVDTEKKLWEQVKRQKEKMFLIASNSKFALEIADQILYLENGKMHKFENLEDAVSNSEAVRQMVGR